MSLIALLFLASILYSLLLIFASRASGKIDPYWSSTIFGVASTIVPFIFWVFARQAHKTPLTTTSAGVAYSIAAGAAAGLFTALLVKIFEKGAVSYAAPAIYGTAIAVTALVGWFFFKETITGLQLAGIAVTLLGVSIIVFSKLSGSVA